eukprot:TRINITY_DN1550_c0_g1_i15.p1 TRINITY_DN1550_c0_g1~~TRINITY_DN1550_c0_g1_i15.p1  ORF type:complete len:162 (+),score=36.79 TRINITY_DN1550_c0_g1_i15:129-614(+)
MCIRDRYKKSQELAQLCGVEIAIICVGPYSKPSIFVASPAGEREDIEAVSRVCQAYSDAMAGKGPGVAMKEPSPLTTELIQLRGHCASLQQEVATLRAHENKPESARTEEIRRLRLLCSSLQQEVASLGGQSEVQQPDAETAELAMAADRLAVFASAQPID